MAGLHGVDAGGSGGVVGKFVAPKLKRFVQGARLATKTCVFCSFCPNFRTQRINQKRQASHIVRAEMA